MTSPIIYKYKVTDKVSMPHGAKILHTAYQGTNLVLWAEVDPSQPLQDRHFAVYATGEPIELTSTHRYIGTAFLVSCGEVYHVYEV